jgi:hypothetical protein
LLELPLRFPPEGRRSVVQAPSFFGKLNEAASAVCGRRPDRDEAVAFKEADHLSHRRPFDIEPFGKGVDRGTSHLVQCCQREELRDAQARRLEMTIVEAGNLPACLPHCEAVALIDSKRLVERQHLVPLLTSFDCQNATRTREGTAIIFDKKLTPKALVSV